MNNPYLNAKRKFRDINGSILSLNRMYQFIALVSLLITVVAVGGLVYLAGQSKFIPYVVEVDQLGQTAAVRSAEQASPTDPRVIKSAVAAFIANSRLVTPDISLQRKAILDLYANMEAGQASTHKMNEFLNGDSKKTPFARAVNETVTVEVLSVLAQSPNTWQVTWLENTRTREGSPISLGVRWTALVTIYQIPPNKDTTEEDIFRNPLGIYISDFSWTKQL